MSIFANGTEAMIFEEQHCLRGCVHAETCTVMERSFWDEPTPELSREDWPRCSRYEMTPGWKPDRLTFRQALRRWWHEWASEKTTPWKRRLGERLRENPRLCFVGVILWQQDIITWGAARRDWHSRVGLGCDRNCWECER